MLTQHFIFSHNILKCCVNLKTHFQIGEYFFTVDPLVSEIDLCTPQSAKMIRNA